MGKRIPPSITKRLSAAINRWVRGPHAAEVVSEGLLEVATTQPSRGLTAAEYAHHFLSQLEVPSDKKLQRAVAEVPGALDPKLSPMKRGEALLESQVPGLNKEAKKFLARGGVLTQEDLAKARKAKIRAAREARDVKKRQIPLFEVEPRGRRRRKTPTPPPGTPPGPPPDRPIQDPGRLLTPRNDTPPFRDIGPFVRVASSPGFALSFNEVGKGIHRTQRRGRFESIMRASQMEGELARSNEIFNNLSFRGQAQTSRAMFPAVNLPPALEQSAAFVNAMKPLSNKEKAAVMEIRGFIKKWLRKREDLKTKLSERTVREFSRNSGQKFTPTQRRFMEDALKASNEKKGLLEQAGLLTWGPEQFMTIDKHGKLRHAAFPWELSDVDFSGNVAFRHLFKEMPEKADIIEPLKAITAGMIRRDVLEPAWDDMRMAARILPKNMRNYVKLWLRELRGQPGVLSEGFDEWLASTSRRLGTSLPITKSSQVAAWMLGGFYRGALAGNENYYLANFFGQAFLNPAAKNGPFAAFEGISNHFNRSIEGVPQEAFMGGFQAIFGREIPKGEFAREFTANRGVKRLRGFFRELGEQYGPTRSEYVNRSVGMHIGVKDALDRYNSRMKQANPRWIDVTVDEVWKAGVLDENVRMNLIFEGILDSEIVNFLYGIDGRNPVIAQMLGRAPVAMSTQFLSWIPRQAEYLFGPIMREGDPGILINYLLLSGWMARLAGTAWGMDFSPMTLFGARFPTRKYLPLPFGPPVQMLSLFMQAIGTEDEEEAREIWKEFGRTVELGVVPGDIALRTKEQFIKSLKNERLLTRDKPWETVDQWGPTAAEQQGPMFGPAGVGAPGGFTRTEANLARTLANIARSETPARFLGVPTLSDRQRRRMRTAIRRSNSQFRRMMTEITEQMVITIQERGVESPEFQALAQAAEAEGLPVAGMVESGVVKVILPTILRYFLNNPALTQAMYIEEMRALYPNYFDPEYMHFDVDPQLPQFREEPSLQEQVTDEPTGLGGFMRGGR
jgi:hypothetical protein